MRIRCDNNAAEIAIRSFCVGKNNWHLIDTVNGAESSAIAYSLAESAKANNDASLDFLEDLLTWSETFQPKLTNAVGVPISHACRALSIEVMVC